jgi:hypothetical protein
LDGTYDEMLHILNKDAPFTFDTVNKLRQKLGAIVLMKGNGQAEEVLSMEAETINNQGTYFDTIEQSMAYWLARTAKPENSREPFVYYVFSNEFDARSALLELPYIHEDKDTGKPVCDEIFSFGNYQGQIDGKPTDEYHAFVAGAELTVEMWQNLHDTFKKFGGRIHDDCKPVENVESVSSSKGNAKTVVFVREDKTDMATYLTYKASCKTDAMAFLSEQQITKSAYFVVVETPDGNFGKDILGVYVE